MVQGWPQSMAVLENSSEVLQWIEEIEGNGERMRRRRRVRVPRWSVWWFYRALMARWW
jgi:hypothetical protein